MPARYLLRFDDLCPTMDRAAWVVVEEILAHVGVAPILAVVPDNRDDALRFADPEPGFWDRVRSWQARGWTIGLHGYQHCYVTHSAGLTGLKTRSEFAGLPEAEQAVKLDSALAIFRREGVRPDVWVAPGHSFDRVTLRCLWARGIRVVSDGFSLAPVVDGGGMVHVPQQLWRLRRVPFGLWTVCYHHNGWTRTHIDRFARDVARFRPAITSLADALRECRATPEGVADRVFARGCRLALRVRGAFLAAAARGRP